MYSQHCVLSKALSKSWWQLSHWQLSPSNNGFQVMPKWNLSVGATEKSADAIFVLPRWNNAARQHSSMITKNICLSGIKEDVPNNLWFSLLLFKLIQSAYFLELHRFSYNLLIDFSDGFPPLITNLVLLEILMRPHASPLWEHSAAWSVVLLPLALYLLLLCWQKEWKITRKFSITNGRQEIVNILGFPLITGVFTKNIFICLKERQRYEIYIQRKVSTSSHFLVSSANICNSRGWARTMPRVQSSIRVSHTDACPGCLTWCH